MILSILKKTFDVISFLCQIFVLVGVFLDVFMGKKIIPDYALYVFTILFVLKGILININDFIQWLIKKAENRQKND